MKKLVLALAAVASLGASVASAGSLAITNKGAYTVEITPVESKNYFTGKERYGDKIEIFVGQTHTFEYGIWDKIIYNIQSSSNGDTYWNIPKDENQILHFHGTLWNPWISN